MRAREGGDFKAGLVGGMRSKNLQLESTSFPGFGSMSEKRFDLVSTWFSTSRDEASLKDSI
jgi:hypothetical protein